MRSQDLIAAFETLAEAPNAVTRLRELVLQLAVRGQLVRQNPREESATVLLRLAAQEKMRAVSDGEVPAPRQVADLPTSPTPMFDVPEGWTWALLDELAIYIQRGKSPQYDDASPMKVVSQKCVQWAGFDISRARGLKLQSLDTYGPERLLKLGDLLWNSTGTGTVGRINVFPGCPDDFAIVADSHVTVIRPALINPRFLYFWLAGPEVQRKIEELTTGTTKQQELGTGTVRGQSVPVAPLAEQDRIVARVDELIGLLDRLEAARNAREDTRAALRDAALAALQEADTPEEVDVAWGRIANRMDDLFTNPADVEPLRQTVLQLAVRGRLVPQDPNDEPASVLLERIAEERDRLVERMKVRNQKALQTVSEEEVPFEVPPTWAWSRAQEITQPGKTITYGILKPIWVDSGVPTVRVTEMKTGTVDAAALPHCDPARAAKFAKTRLEEGDLLISKDGTIGKTAFVPPQLDGGNITQHLLRFGINRELDRHYVRVVIDAPLSQAWMKGETKGVALKGINVGDFRRMPVPVPPLAEQHRIVAKVDELMGLLDRLEERLVRMTAAHDAFAAAAVHHLNA